jgi:phospholipid/cholesterol/gamma-HCH transport system substrate-binding protein
MRRATFITWEQLRVGSLIVVALVLLVVAISKLGEAANLFTSRYELVALLPSAAGLREGGSVTVAGQLAGIVKRIEFLPPDGDTTRNLKVTVEIDQQIQPQIREDSEAKLRTMGLLGDKVLDIRPGTPRAAVLQAGDTVSVSPSLDYDEVLAQASGAVGDLVALTRDLRSITGGIVRGEGTMGQLLTSRTVYDQLSTTLSRMNTVLARLERSDGTFGRLLDDPTLYHRVVSTTAQLDSLLVGLRSQQGTLGRLMYDDSLYTRMVSASTRADSILSLLTAGNGFAARMLSDQQLYDQLNKAVTDLNAILEDLRRNPQKYMRGLIKVF